jgi:probable HAF family extracellular repeat protein
LAGLFEPIALGSNRRPLDSIRPELADRCFFWQNGKVIDLGTLGGANCSPKAINERGQIVGYADTRKEDEDGFAIHHAFVWQKGKMTDLGALGGHGAKRLRSTTAGRSSASARPVAEPSTPSSGR